MRLIVTALIFVIGLAMLGLAVSFMVQPLSVRSLVGIDPAGSTHALSTMRGDLGGFFGIIGITMLWGAWKRSGDMLLVPAIIMVLVIIGRLIGYVQDGTYEGFAGAVGAEAVIAGLLLWARAILPHHALKDVGD